MERMPNTCQTTMASAVSYAVRQLAAQNIKLANVQLQNNDTCDVSP